MDKCSFSEIVGSDCGPIIPPRKDTFVDEIISLEDCRKDILGHMKQLQLSRSEITTEAELILSRAGKTLFLFDFRCAVYILTGVKQAKHHLVFSTGIFNCLQESLGKFKICAYHRHVLGIGWRGKRKHCQVPPELSNHKEKPPIADRSIDKKHSCTIKSITAKLVPVGSGMFIKLTFSSGDLLHISPIICICTAWPFREFRVPVPVQNEVILNVDVISGLG